MNLSTIKNILIIRLSSLGDILLSTPLVRTLKNLYPQVKIHYLLKTHYQDALKLNPDITKLFLYEPTKDKINTLIEELKNCHFDMVLDLQNNLRSKQIVNSLNIKTLKFYKHSIDKFLLVNFKINRLYDAPPIPIRYAQTIPGFEPDDKGLELYTENQTSELLENKRNLIGFAPGSRHFTKMWPQDYYEFLGKLLVQADYTVVLFGGKDDKQTCSELEGKIEGAINLCNNDELLQTAVDMKKCLAIVCNDSGLMHVACAMKVPVLSFFGSTVKEFGFTPYRNKNLILENKSLTCRPCSHTGRAKCPKGHFRCMLDISPEKAFEELMTLIEK